MKKECMICGSSQLEEVVQIRGVPTLSNVLWNSREDAMNSVRGDIRLVFCGRCEVIFNAAFDPTLVEYDCEYENSLHFSGEFNRYCERLARDLCERHRLYNKTIMEIGCGQGTFLSMVQRIGDNTAVGFDPSYRGETEETPASKMTIHASEFPPDKGLELLPDFLCCRHVLEHISEPVRFVKSIAPSERGPGSLYFEVPNALHILRTFGIWDLLYEHCTYYTPEALKRLFTIAGFANVHIREGFHGQFLAMEAWPDKLQGRTFQSSATIPTMDMRQLVNQFCHAANAKTGEWKQLMHKRLSRDERIAVWGAGAKGIMFLNILGLNYTQVPYIVDINPIKHNRFLTGTGQKIINSSDLADYKPDAVIVMNPAYIGEIQKDLKQVGLDDVEILTA